MAYLSGQAALDWQPPKQDSLPVSILKNLASPFVNLGKMGAETVKEGAYTLSGIMNKDLSKAAGIGYKPITDQAFYDEYKRDPLAMGAKTGLQIGSYAIPGGGTLGQVVTKGALAGGMYGAGAADWSKPEDILKQGAQGALMGGGTAGVLHGVGKGLEKLSKVGKAKLASTIPGDDQLDDFVNSMSPMDKFKARERASALNIQPTMGDLDVEASQIKNLLRAERETLAMGLTPNTGGMGKAGTSINKQIDRLVQTSDLKVPKQQYFDDLVEEYKMSGMADNIAETKALKTINLAVGSSERIPVPKLSKAAKQLVDEAIKAKQSGNGLWDRVVNYVSKEKGMNQLASYKTLLDNVPLDDAARLGVEGQAIRSGIPPEAIAASRSVAPQISKPTGDFLAKDIGKISMKYSDAAQSYNKGKNLSPDALAKAKANEVAKSYLTQIPGYEEGMSKLAPFRTVNRSLMKNVNKGDLKIGPVTAPQGGTFMSEARRVLLGGGSSDIGNKIQSGVSNAAQATSSAMPAVQRIAPQLATEYANQPQAPELPMGTESNVKDTGYTKQQKLAPALQTYQNLLAQGYKDTEAKTMMLLMGMPVADNPIDMKYETDRLGALDDLATMEKTLEGTEGLMGKTLLPNILAPADVQMWNAARENIKDLWLRSRTGAAAPDSEKAAFDKLLPRFGDKPEAVKEKMRKLKLRLESM